MPVKPIEQLNADTALAISLAEIEKIGEQTDTLHSMARDRLDEVRPLLIGKRVRAFGHVYQISQVSITRANQIHGYGVRVNRKGQAGVRGYDIGTIVNWTML